MADILIKGMEMPTKVNHPLFIRISSDGHIVKGDFIKGGFIETEAKAIELPPHGILKDTDFMLECLEAIKKDYPEAHKLISGVIERTPTVLEASK